MIAALVALVALLGGGVNWWFTVEQPRRDARAVVALKEAMEEEARIEAESRQNLLSQGIDPDTGGALQASTVRPMWIPDLAGLHLVPIPAGEFTMGSVGTVAYWSDEKQPGDEEGRDRDEGPQTTVVISEPYLLGQSEVTNAQWLTLMRDKMSAAAIAEAESNPDHPAVMLTWDEAMEFGERLTLREWEAGRLPDGLVYTLPTEAQWEYACRAGTTTPYAGDMPTMAWFEANSEGRSHPVMQRQPNAWGLYDMHGNVWERVWDNYGNYPGGTVTDWTGDNRDHNSRVFRGGSFEDSARLQRSAYRGRYTHWDRREVVGFRIALVSGPFESGRRLRIPEGYLATGLEEIRNKLLVISSAAESYFLENGVEEVRLGALLSKYLNQDVDWLQETYLGESYFALNPLEKNKPLEVKTRDGQMIRYEP